MYYLNKIYKSFARDNSIMIGGIIFLFCIPFLYLTNFIHPSGDDYSYAFLELKSPFYKAYIDEYLLWNGRFVSNAFVLKNPLTFGFNNIGLYRFVVGLVQLALFFSFFLILSKAKSIFNFKTRFILSGFFFLAYLLLIPALNEGFYWYTGIITYQLAIIFCIVYLYLISKTHSFSRLPILILLQALIAGSNEIAMIYLILFHFILLAIQIKKSAIFLFITAILFGLIVFFAPGNSIRSSYFEGVSHQFFHSLFMSLLQVFRFCLVLNYGLFLFISAFIFYFRLPNLNTFFNNFKLINQIYILPVILFLLLFVSIFPAYWTTGIMGQHRTVNFAFFICIPILFYWYLLVIQKYETFFIKVNSRISKFSILFLLVSIFLTKNFKGVITDISFGKHIKFDEENNERYLLIDKQFRHKKKDVYLTKLKTHPSSIFIYDLENDPNHLVNLGYQRYWKIPGKVLLNP